MTTPGRGIRRARAAAAAVGLAALGAIGITSGLAYADTEHAATIGTVTSSTTQTTDTTDGATSGGDSTTGVVAVRHRTVRLGRRPDCLVGQRRHPRPDQRELTWPPQARTGQSGDSTRRSPSPTRPHWTTRARSSQPSSTTSTAPATLPRRCRAVQRVHPTRTADADLTDARHPRRRGADRGARVAGAVDPTVGQRSSPSDTTATSRLSPTRPDKRADRSGSGTRSLLIARTPGWWCGRMIC